MTASDAWTLAAVVVGVVLSSIIAFVGWICARSFNDLATTVNGAREDTQKLRIDAATVDIRLTAAEADIIELRHRIDRIHRDDYVAGD